MKITKLGIRTTLLTLLHNLTGQTVITYQHISIARNDFYFSVVSVYRQISVMCVCVRAIYTHMIDVNLIQERNLSEM